MNKVTFVLKSQAPGKHTAIKLFYTCSDGRLQYYTGESIDPADWPNKIPRGTKAILNRIESTVGIAVTDCKIKGERLTRESLRLRLDTVLHKSTPKSPGNFFTDAELIIEQMESGLLVTPQKKRYTAGTIKRLRFTLGRLNAFNPTLKTESITIETYNKFVQHCQAKGLSNNSTDESIKVWKSLGRQIGTNPVFDDPKFKRLQEDTQDIFLDEKELTAIMDLKLPYRFAVVRDWFIIGCFTGLRVSDLLRLKPHNVDKNFITIANEKTSEKVVIPLHPMAKAVLKKYKGFPPKITDVELNRTIKEVAKRAGLTDDVLYTVTEGGKRKDYYLKKWQMVSSHTMRRSAVTNLTRADVKETLVMQITGIKSFATLKRYIKLSPEEAATIAAGLAFYK